MLGLGTDHFSLIISHYKLFVLLLSCFFVVGGYDSGWFFMIWLLGIKTLITVL